MLEVPIKKEMYFVVNQDCFLFLKGYFDLYEKSFTDEIDVAFRSYRKDMAFQVSDDCIEEGMDTMVVMVSAQDSLENNIVGR